MLVASKVTVSPQLLESPRLKGKRKTTLRRKLIMDYITEQPSGEVISIGAFQKVGQFSTPANTHTFVQRMVRDGMIMKHNSDRPKQYYYSVVGAVRTRKIEKEPEVQETTFIPEEPAQEQKLYPQVLQLAQQFAWETRSINVRDFVEWVRVLEGGEPKTENTTLDNL